MLFNGCIIVFDCVSRKYIPVLLFVLLLLLCVFKETGMYCLYFVTKG